MIMYYIYMNNLLGRVFIYETNRCLKGIFPMTPGIERPYTQKTDVKQQTQHKNLNFPFIIPNNSLFLKDFQDPVLPEGKKVIKPAIKAIQYAGNPQNEDKIAISCLQSIKADVVSVFDGHGGVMLSDYCANRIAQQLQNFLITFKGSETYKNNIDKLISDALINAYKEMERSFFENVYQQQMILKNKKIKNIGTCGITVVIFDQKIYVANCGDSMAMIVTHAQDNVGTVELHQCLSVNNQNERQRLFKEFPHDQDILVEENKGVYYLKGRLQPTRTLGDYHMKHKELWKGKGCFNGPYVKTQPDISIHKIEEKFKYLVVGSDGVWDYLDKWEVAQACMQEKPEEQILNAALQKIGRMNGLSVDKVKKINRHEKRDYHDDISAIVVSLQAFE